MLDAVSSRRGHPPHARRVGCMPGWAGALRLYSSCRGWMNPRPETCGERSHDRRGCQHPHRDGRRSSNCLFVAKGTPPQQCPLMHQIRARIAIEGHKASIGQAVYLSKVCPLRAVCGHTLLVQDIVDQCRSRALRAGDGRVGSSPGRAKQVKTPALALGAGAVSCGEPSGFIEKEEFSVLARCHHRAAPVLEIEQAQDPALALIHAADLSSTIVQAATIPHECAARRSCHKFTERCHPIPSWHDITACR